MLNTKIVLVISLICISLGLFDAVNAQKVHPGHKQVHNFIIQGEIKGLKGGLVYLSYRENQKDIKDSTRIEGGKFTFNGNIAEPVFSSIYTNNHRVYIGFFLDHKIITVTADTLGKRTVAGSPVQDIYKEWADQWEVVRQKAGGIYKRMDEAYKREGKNPKDRGAKLSDTIRRAFDEEFRLLGVESDSTVFPFVRKYPNSEASAFVIVDRYISWPDGEKAQKLYDYLTDEIKKSTYGREIQKFLTTDAKTAVGAPAVDFIMSDTTGKQVKLSDFKGRYVLLDFWASWCGPCRKENPNVVVAYSKFHDKGFEVIQVSLDTNKEAWVGAIKKDGLTWIHLSDLKGWKNEAAALYGVKAVPTNFLIDKNGKIIARNLRGEDLEKRLSEVVK